MTAETSSSTIDIDIHQASHEMQPTQQNEDVTSTGIPSERSPKGKPRSRRMSLNELVHSLSPPPSARQLDDIPEKHLPYLTPEERKKIDGVSRTIYDIQREQAACALESQVDLSTLHVNPFRSFEQLSPEEQERWRNVKERGGAGTTLLASDQTQGDLRFGKIKNAEGDEIYGVWRVPPRDDEINTQDQHETNEVIKRLEDFANSPPLVTFSSSTVTPGFFSRNGPDPPTYASRPPSPEERRDEEVYHPESSS
ncbi:hypothetical protein I302_102306 [Kwoniella bestiolae CBS 10118]|uniref:Uncharacterized protein n=1 Tax=Kwoniella bestiolae CBS 10118 TaxID=1296100 RepID=A0A1B9GEJ6_9TREE|nr:hypothetical protein I302_00998 [Kwoniella bestiolae CBS 10118]OCF29492.1 hypothetical protein I302_00998 [Kwoniella bestiolae CBS 10118]